MQAESNGYALTATITGIVATHDTDTRPTLQSMKDATHSICVAQFRPGARLWECSDDGNCLACTNHSRACFCMLTSRTIEAAYHRMLLGDLHYKSRDPISAKLRPRPLSFVPGSLPLQIHPSHPFRPADRASAWSPSAWGNVSIKRLGHSCRRSNGLENWFWPPACKISPCVRKALPQF